MNSLFIDKRGISLRIDGNALCIYEDKQRVNAIPLAPLKRIFLHSDVELSARVLGKLGEWQIGLVVLYGYTEKPVLLMPTYSKDASRRQQQYQLSQNPHLALSFAKQLVAQKIQGHLHVIQHVLPQKPSERRILTKTQQQLESLLTGSLKTCHSVETLRGLEGAAAASYFEMLAHILPASLDFKGRNRRPPKDPFNVLLSLGYSLLHSEAVLALHAAGLDPYVGFYHVLEHGRESLACDLVEPLRHHIDLFCWQLISEQTLNARDFGYSDNACQLNKAGRTRFYQAYEKCLTTLRKRMWHAMRDMGHLFDGKPFEFEAVLLSEME